MKHLKIIPALILSMALTAIPAAAHGNDDCDSGESTEYREEYTYHHEIAAVSFGSYKDYTEHAGEVFSDYAENYDYLYVPDYLKDSTEDITNILITPTICTVTYQIGDVTAETKHYYCYDFNNGETDEKNMPPKFRDAVRSAQKTVCGGMTYHKTIGINHRTHIYYCICSDSHFIFDEPFIGNMNGNGFVKLYTDKHLQEENGALYYIGDSGKKETGWKTSANGHTYYFRKDSGKAVQGGLFSKDGIMYQFNHNGVCTGRYTGYSKKPDGSRVYYKDGRINEN